MRVLCDVHIPYRLINRLRELGVDATHVNRILNGSATKDAERDSGRETRAVSPLELIDALAGLIPPPRGARAQLAVARARGPPAWDGAPEPAPDWDLAAQPEPELEFDQRITW